MKKNTDTRRLSVFAHRFVERRYSEKVKGCLSCNGSIYHGKESELVLALQIGKVAGKVIGLLDDIVLRHITQCG